MFFFRILKKYPVFGTSCLVIRKVRLSTIDPVGDRNRELREANTMETGVQVIDHEGHRGFISYGDY